MVSCQRAEQEQGARMLTSVKGLSEQAMKGHSLSAFP